MSYKNDVLFLPTMKNITLSFLLIVILILRSDHYIIAQVTGSSDTTETKVESDERMESLVQRYNKTHTIHGYRIQIISSSKKDKAKRAKSKFAAKHHGYMAHEIYQQPFFIIKVGDFLTKIEAEKFHREIKHEFQGSFVLPDIVEPYNQYVYKRD